ncbi:MAG TPA: transporter substrate-binding domain-containing protein [Castellaniella sp.]|uniref:transporter substrate-binding domain-containing protein n=1 Tax=Castellaniella sp. TaxID=1955812 RepID=UPI002EF36160
MGKTLTLTAFAVALGFSALTAAHADAVSDIQARGTLVVGVKADYRPFGYLDASGKIVGFGPDLAADVAKQLGVKLQMVPVVASNRVQYLQQGKIDIILATLTDTPQRDKLMDMVDPHYYGAGVNILAPKSADFKSWDQLRGKKVCLIQGTFTNKDLQTQYGVQGLAFPGTAEAYSALRNGSCAAFAYDDTAIQGELLKPQWKDYDMPLTSIFFTPWSIGAKKGENHFASVLSKMVVGWHKSGKILDLEKKWGIKPIAFAQQEHEKYSK